MWIGHLRIKGNHCGYKEKDRGLKGQFVNGINDDNTMAEVMNELTAPKRMNEIMSEQVLSWDRRAKVQGTRNINKGRKIINNSML